MSAWGQWRWQASWSYVDGSIDTAAGERELPYTHRDMVKVALDWLRGPYSLSIRPHYYGEVTRQDSDPQAVSHLQTVPGYALWTLQSNWQMAPQWTLALTVDNALDKRYHNTGGNGFQTMPSAQAPREWWLSVSWQAQ